MIVFCWKGFPQYAARCIRAFVQQTTEDVVVIGSAPDVPIQGMAALVGCPVYWVDEDDTQVNIQTLVGEMPTHLFLSGWSVKSFMRMADDVRATGGKVIGMIDTHHVFSLKQCLRALRFRLCFRRKYDAYLVPGKSSIDTLRFFGVAPTQIVTGMYAADATLFTDGGDLTQRPKTIVYVGRLCERKNVRGLCKAFIAAKGPEHGWALELYGCGEQKELLPHDHPAIHIHDFLQPEQLAAVYRSARAFVLPSFDEPWGLVVHEAALSGCVLLLSDRIGAARDFLTPENGFTFNPTSQADFINAFQQLFTMDAAALQRARAVSLTMAQAAGTNIFANAIQTLCAKLPLKLRLKN